MSELRNQTCSANECARHALCRSAIGPLCGLHYQRYAKHGSVELRQRIEVAMLCSRCDSPVESKYGRVRFKKRGYGYCSKACDGAAKTERASEDSSMRFMKRVNMGDPEQCWTFRGKKNWAGYPQFHWRAPGDKRARPHGAHRMMWLVLNGPIPVDKEVCHSCDNPACVNPGHLWLGTHKQNMEDMSKKGRGSKFRPKGEAHPQARLTEDQVLEIRSSKEGHSQIAKRFGVTSANISSIRKRQIWTHV